MSIGANILAPWVDDRARMFDYLVRLNPRMVVVCDEPNVAATIKSALPNCAVIHRWVRDGDGSHINWPADEWVRSFALPLPKGVMGYLLNEPAGNWRALSTYLATVMSHCGALNIPLCVGNFSKGNPPVDALNAGELDELLMAFNDWPLHRLGYHPYWKNDPDIDPHARWHIPILNRAGQIGARVRLFATESGRDEHGAYEDGYRMHMTNAEYGEREVRHARTLSAAGIEQAPFAYGKGGPETVNGVERFKWEQFDHQNNLVAQAAFIAYNAGASEGTDDMAPPGWNTVTTKQPGVNVRVRAAPGLAANTLTTIKTGDWAAKLPGSTVQKDGYTWQLVAVQKDAVTHVHGFVATEVIEV